jgi:hypothetical protein
VPLELQRRIVNAIVGHGAVVGGRRHATFIVVHSRLLICIKLGAAA